MNSAAILWVGAAFAGFLVWWPIGVAFLTAITITAISQQLTGYQPQGQLPPQRAGNRGRSVGEEYVESLRIERAQVAMQSQTERLIAHEKARQIKYEGARQVGQAKRLAITDQSGKTNQSGKGDGRQMG